MRLHEIELTTSLCGTCRKMCRHICPTHLITRSEADTPNQRGVVAFQAMRRGEFRPVEVGNMYEKCTDCGACASLCGSKSDAGKVMLHARADIVGQGLAPAAALAVNRSVIENGNPFGLPRAARFAPLAAQLANLPEQADVLYFVGCHTAYQQPEVALAMFDLLEMAGVNFTILRQETSCGEPQYSLGFWDEAQETARSVAAQVRASGAKRVVFSSASSLRFMQEKYACWGAALPDDIELVHASEFLNTLLSTGHLKLQGQLTQRVTYHDSCELGRKLGLYDAPRAVIAAAAGAQFQEMAVHHAAAVCCGAGGGLSHTNSNLAGKMGRSITDMAHASGAEIMVTGCTRCQANFRSPAGEHNGLRVMDIAELLLLAARA